MKIAISLLLILQIFFVSFSQMIIEGQSSELQLKLGSKGNVNSIIQYSEKIVLGFSNNNNVIQNSTDVLLDFGFKDIVLASNKSSIVNISIDKDKGFIESQSLPESNQISSEKIINNQYYALLIAINEYSHSSTYLPNLAEPISDAIKLREILINQYTFNTRSMFYF
ncbi:MAG: hypothetical protein HC905_23685 [Bacteroidales bacterium]|nr:hypothetical protein [Bacteroidales bacterium]